MTTPHPTPTSRPRPAGVVTPDEVPKYARPFVAVVGAMMVASVLFLWEPWPFTSFRLFSHLRYDEQVAWQATAVTASRGEVSYGLSDAPRGLRGFGFVMDEFVSADDARQDEICRAWLEEAPGLIGEPVSAVSLYERHWRLSERRGDRAAPGTRQLEYTCTGQGATSVDG